MSSKNELKSFIDIIPRLKNIVAKNLNQKNKTEHDEEYWWFLSGLYACNIWRVVQLYFANKVNINDFLSYRESHKMYHFDFLNRLNKSWINNDITYVEKDNNDYLNVVLKDEMANISNITYEPFNSNYINIYKPKTKIINFLFRTLYSIKKYKSQEIKISTNTELDLFESLYLKFLPKEYYSNYPKAAESIAKLLSKFLVKNVCNTFNGYELNIFDQMMIGFRKTNSNNFILNTVAHGFGSSIGYGHLYYATSSNYIYSTQYENKLGLLNLKKGKKEKDYDALIIAPSCKNISKLSCDTFDSEIDYQIKESHFNEIINLMSLYVKQGLKIKLRLKDSDPDIEKYINNIEIEQRAFEKSFQDYKLIIGTEVGTIIGKCLYNKVNFISYDKKVSLYDENIEKKIKMQSGNIYQNFGSFKEALAIQLSKILLKKNK